MSELEDRIRERALRRQQSDAGMSVVGTRGANSDIAGRANALSRRLGIPADVIERNIQEIEDRDRAQANARMVRDASPYVRDWFANPRNAAAAKDDVPALVSMSGRYAAIGKFGAPKPQTDFRKAPDRRTYATDTQAKKDLAQDLFDATAEGPLAAQYRYQDQTPTDIGAAMKDFEWDQKSLVGKAGTVARETITGVIPSTVAGFYGQTAPNAQGFTSALSDVVEGIGSEFVGFGADLLNMYFGVRLEGDNPFRQMTENRHAREKAMAEQSSAYAKEWRPETSNWISEEINQGFESLPTSVLALATRDPKLASSLMGSATAGGEYVRAREAGLSLPEALAYGARQGVVEALTEHMPASKFLGDLASKSPFGKMLFNQLATEMPGEQVATILQSFDEWVTLNPDKPLSEYVATLPDQMRQTFLATLGTVGAMTGGAALARGTVNVVSKAQAARARGQMRNAVEAVETQAGANIMDGIMEDAAKSKIRQTDPEAFRQYLEGATAGTPVENVYIPGDAIRELMQDGYRDAPFWSDHADQIDEAIALGGDVVLPLADVATNLAGTPEWQVLREDARFSPGGMSTAELASLSEAYAKDREIGQARIAEEMDRAARDAEPVNRVYQSYREQFQNAGFRPDAADRYASIWVANREAWAQRLGMGVEEYDAANPVEFRRVLPEGLARAIPVDGLDMVINAMRAPEKAERKGPSLLDFIASRGGIEDRGGDIASMGGDQWHREKKFRKRLLKDFNEAQGNMLGGATTENSIERTIEAARDAGYDVDETNFLDTVGAELRGQPVYANEALTQSETERVRAAAEDLRRILLDRGVDPDGATKGEIEQAVEAYRKEELSGRGLEQARDGSGGSSSGSLAPLAGAPSVLGFDITPEMRASAREGFPLFQQGGEQPRGRVSGGLISGTEGPAIVELFEGSDMSTVLHETSHIWLEELKRNALLPDAPEDVREDWRTVEAWFAENGFPVADDFIPTEAHEMFARAGEQYFMEGKAPSSTLKRAFDTFRGWLLNIYQVVANLRTPINPDIRRVFDRMLATREALDDYADRQQLQARFENAEQAGMTEQEFAAYDRLAREARTEAYDALLFRTMATIRKERTKEYKARAASVRDSVTESVNKRPAFRALHLLRTGRFLDDPEREPMKVKLDRGWLVERFGEDALMMLPKAVPPLYKERGDNPDTVANLAGFTSGEDMVRALMGLERQKEQMREAGDRRGVREATIANETNAIMEERYGNPLDDGSIEEEALAAVHNEKEGELIAAENRQLARRSNKRPTAYRLAREWAREKIAKGRVVDVASKAALQRYARAQAKAAREFEAALVAGNIDEAFRASETRLLNHALIAEAKAAADQVEVAVNRLSRLSRTPVRKSTDQEYMDRAQALLAKFEFRPRSQKLLDEMEAFGAWAADQAANGVDVVVPPRLESDGVHYSRMSVEELIGLDESVSQLLHLGRMKKTLLDAKEQRDFDAVVGEAVSVIEDLPQRKQNNRMRPSWLDDRRAGLASADAALLKMEQVFDWLDNGDPNGVFNRMVFRPIADAQDAERAMVGEYLGKVRDLLRAMPKENVARWEDHVSTPELLNRETGQPFDLTRQELVAMALNTGNEGNFDKLVRGYGWNADAVMRVLSRELTAEDWRFVQATWDLIDTLWPQVEALEKRVNGVAPEKIEARAFEVHVGDQTIAMRGGYYPVVYDPLKSIDAEVQAAKNSDALFSNSYARATTPKGFTKERTGVVRPILLSMSVINRHLTEVIHDVTHREVIIQADKLLGDRRVMKAVDNAFGREVRKQMRPWLQHIANEWAVDRRGLEGWDSLAKRLRTHSTIIGMGYRLTSVLAQTAGYAGVMEAIGSRWMASGMKATMSDPVGTYDFVMERSKEVSSRMETMERDINANIRDLQGKSGLLANVRRFAFHGIGYMDRVVVVPAWIGSYNKALREGMSEDEAVYYADKIIRATQGSGAAKDLAAVQRNNEWMRLATMFYSYASAFYNRQRNLGRDAAGAWREKDAKALPSLVARAWWLFAVAPLLGALPGALLSGGGPDDDKDETWFGWAMGVMGANFFYGIPIVRDVASSAASGFDYSFTPASRMIDTIMRAGSDLVALADMDEETEPSKRAVKTAVESVGYVAKLPVGQISNAAQFIADWASGEADPDGVGDWLTGLQRGKLEE